VIDLDGDILAPGLIEGHTHLTRTTVSEFARGQVAAGVTTSVVESMELGYVAGPAGIRELLEESAASPGRVFWTVSGSIAVDRAHDATMAPAEDWVELLDHPLVAGVGGVSWADALRGHARTEALVQAALDRGLAVEAAGPPAGGITLLQMLNYLEGFDFAGVRWPSLEASRRRCEAMDFAFRDRDLHLADPDFAEVPVDRLTAKEYAAAARGAHDAGTTHVCVIDGEGTAVSLTHTLGSSSGVVTRIEPVAAALPREFQRTFVPVERQQVMRVEFDENEVVPPLFTKVQLRSAVALPAWISAAWGWIRSIVDSSDADTIAAAVRAGANVLVAGTAVFGEADGVAAALSRLRYIVDSTA